MKMRIKLASVALLGAAVASQGALAQSLGQSPRGSNTGQDTTAPGSKGDQQRRARAGAHGSGDPASGDSSARTHGSRASAPQAASPGGGGAGGPSTP